MTKRDDPQITYIHPGPFPILIAYADCKKSYLKEMKRVGIKNPSPFITDGAGATTHIFSRKGEATLCVVCVNGKGRTIEQIYALLTHEAVHCWQETRDAMREEKPSSEVEAYTIQYYAQRFMEEFTINFDSKKRKR